MTDEYTIVIANGAPIPRSEFPSFLDDLARLHQDIVTQAYLSTAGASAR